MDDKLEALAATDLFGGLGKKELDAIALRAMQMKPEDRYESAEALAADVESYLEGRLELERRDQLDECHAGRAVGDPQGPHVGRVRRQALGPRRPHGGDPLRRRLVIPLTVPGWDESRRAGEP